MSRLPCCAAAPAGDGFQRKLLGTALGPGVVFNLVCRLLRSLSFLPSLTSLPPSLLFSLPPLAIILASGEREGPAFFVSNFGAAIGPRPEEPFGGWGVGTPNCELGGNSASGRKAGVKMVKDKT